MIPPEGSDPRPSAPATVAGAPWLTAQRTQRLVDALWPGRDGETPVRFVGGAIRNTLLGRPVSDVDLATRLAPEEVMRRLEDAGLGCVPTGLKHGTVTAIVEGAPFEVTTLRVDVSTDGRHADVAFTEDWRLDAERRDFTMNAIYADPDGALHDPVGGIRDVGTRTVRFIGDPHQRIAEDYLRVLRFFRFSAWYGHLPYDAAGLAACAAARDRLGRLSAERVWVELKKLLAAPNPAPAVDAMAETAILAAVLPEGARAERFDAVVALDRATGAEPEPIHRLAALIDRPIDVAALARRLRFSAQEAKRLGLALASVPADAEMLTRAGLERAIYRIGREAAEDRLRLALARAGETEPTPRVRELLALVESFAPPECPVRAKDLMALGYAPGPKLGAALDALERMWVESNFTLPREVLLARLDP